MLFSLLAYFSPIISGRARWAGTRHAQIGPAQERHDPKICGMCLAREALWAVLGPLPLPVGRHSPTRESAWPVKHGGPHDPLAERPTTAPDTPIRTPLWPNTNPNPHFPFPPAATALARTLGRSRPGERRCLPPLCPTAPSAPPHLHLLPILPAIDMAS
jgi:hypothetical protein